MAKLTAKQQAQLDKLKALEEAPEPDRPNRSFNITMSYAEAEKLGLLADLNGAADDDDDDGDDDDPEGGDKPPQRRGFFGDNK